MATISNKCSPDALKIGRACQLAMVQVVTKADAVRMVNRSKCDSRAMTLSYCKVPGGPVMDIKGMVGQRLAAEDGIEALFYDRVSGGAGWVLRGVVRAK